MYTYKRVQARRILIGNCKNATRMLLDNWQLASCCTRATVDEGMVGRGTW